MSIAETAGLVQATVAVLLWFGLDFRIVKKWIPGMTTDKRSKAILLLAIGSLFWSFFAIYQSDRFDDSVDRIPVTGKTFRNEVVAMDGKRFENCVFQNVTFLYGGRRAFQIHGCKFLGSKWIRPASPQSTATILLLRGLGMLPSNLQFEGGDTVVPPTPTP